jgi:hypothetical protein
MIFIKRVDAVADVGEGTLLRAAIDQLDGFAADDVAEELGDHPRRAFLGRVDRVQAGANPVEWAEQGVLQAFLLAVGVDHAVHHLLGAGVDPARLVDRAVDQRRALGIELRVLAHAIDLGSGREDDPFLVLDRVPDDRQVGLEVQFEDAQGLGDVGRRGGDGDQRQDDIALAHVILDPLLADQDVAFEEMEARIRRSRSATRSLLTSIP